MKQLEGFHTRSLRAIVGIKWQDRVTNLKVLDRASLLSIEVMILKAQVRWTGHVIHMEPHRLPLQLLYGELRQGQRPRGCPRKPFKDCIKDHLKQSYTLAKDLEVCAQDGAAWRSLTRKAQEDFEDNRRNHITNAIQKRKASVASVCASRIGPSSHTRAHERSSAQWYRRNSIVYQ